MSRRDDYSNDVSRTAITDQDIERLLSGDVVDDPGLHDLTVFVEGLRSFSRSRPDSNQVRDTAMRAATVTRTAQSHVTLTREPGRRAPRSWRFRPVAVAAGALLMLIGMSGAAIAADRAIPGDALYGLDKALERIGIGNGATDERITEAESLVEDGRSEFAYTFLGEHLEEMSTSGNEAEAETIQKHLELAASKSSPNAAVTQERVAALESFIEQNKGEGVGLDGRDFGQAISQIARGQPASSTETGAASGAGADGVGPVTPDLPDSVGRNEDRDNPATESDADVEPSGSDMESTEGEVESVSSASESDTKVDGNGNGNSQGKGTSNSNSNGNSQGNGNGNSQGKGNNG